MKENLLKIFYQLTALRYFYKGEHWTVEGEDFYSQHLFFDRLNEGIRKEIDDLAELLVGLRFLQGFSKNDFSGKKILSESSKILEKIPDISSFLEACEAAESLEMDLLRLIKDTPQNINVGLYNKLAQIGENHWKKTYFLNQTLIEKK